MTSAQVLSEMERKLDELITNANLLRECEEEMGQCADLTQKQETLLNALMTMNCSLDETEKFLLLQKSPGLYLIMEEKVARLSRANQRLLKAAKDKFVKKARTCRRKRLIDR